MFNHNFVFAHFKENLSLSSSLEPTTLFLVYKLLPSFLCFILLGICRCLEVFVIFHCKVSSIKIPSTIISKVKNSKFLLFSLLFYFIIYILCKIMQFPKRKNDWLIIAMEVIVKISYNTFFVYSHLSIIMFQEKMTKYYFNRLKIRKKFLRLKKNGGR